MQYFLEDSFVDASKASVHVHDLGLLRGYCIYECFRCYAKTPFYLQEHIERFYHSALDQGLTQPYSKQELLTIIEKLIEKNNIDNLVFKMFLTAGSSDDHITFLEKPRLIIICHPFKPLAEKYYNNGFKVQSISFERQNPSIKTTAYSVAIQSVHKAKKQGFDDCMYLDYDQNMLELTTSNLFFIKDKTIVTPSEKILFGMTRLVTLKIAKELGFNIVSRTIAYQELKTFDEVFCTSTLKKILPIQSIDDFKIPSMKWTQEFIHAFDTATLKKEAVCF